MTILKTALLVTAAIAQATQWPMVGWGSYRNFDLYKLRPGDITKEFSSYDRKNANDDGFEGTYSCLYNETNGRCVIAEAEGPGEISSIWFTYANDSVIGVGDIQIELDGTVVLEGVVQDIVNGELGPPFVWPLVGNTNDTSGGNVIKVPMPYRESMKISTSKNPHFYHVFYRAFPENVEVETFDLNDEAEDVLEINRHFGTRDPKQPNNDRWNWWRHWWHGSKPASLDVRGKDSIAMQGTGIIDRLEVRVPAIQGAVPVQDDGRAFGKGGSSSFTLAVDGDASQCRIIRRLDTSIGHQQAAVYVNGKQAGRWNDSGPAENVTWLDQSLDLPPALTRRVSLISVENEFVSSDLDFNEFHYSAHCRSGQDQEWTLVDLLNVGPANVHDEQAHGYQITGQTWQGWRASNYSGPRSSQALQSIQMLNDITLRMEFDGKTSVEAPLGSFFGIALGKNQVRSLLLSVDTFIENGAFTSWFPMPFSKNARISLSIKGQALPDNTISVKWHKDPSLARQHPDQPSWGYFSTQHRRAQTTLGELWPFLSLPGPGVAYGVTHTLRGSILPPANTLEFLEGDLQVWYNRTSPGSFASASLLGTGTEDFYEAGWYFAQTGSGYDTTGVPFAMPLTGLTGFVERKFDCVGSCLSPMRLFMGDSLAFDEGISMNIEHGPEGNNINAEYESTAFYYAPY